jgi:GDPmannose 4,6-dehydratase
MKGKKAVIFGITGQDGSYLARLLLDKHYEVYGVTRDLKNLKSENLITLKILDRVTILEIDQSKLLEVSLFLEVHSFDEVYYLSGQSSVGYSFENPIETIDSNVIGILNILEASKKLLRRPKIYNAGSSESYGNLVGFKANEGTPFSPLSPYGIAKATSFWVVRNYREVFGLFACTGVLFNHESPLRPSKFVTQKIVSCVKRIREGSDEILELGELDIYRDWGWAPEYVDAMWRMLQIDVPQDFVVSTGEMNSLESFVSVAFEMVDLDWKKFVKVKGELVRPSELKFSVGDSTSAKLNLNWEAKNKMRDVVRLLLQPNLDMTC